MPVVLENHDTNKAPPSKTVLDPALKDVFGADTFNHLLTLPQAEATALAGVVVNGTQTVRPLDERYLIAAWANTVSK